MKDTKIAQPKEEYQVVGGLAQKKVGREPGLRESENGVPNPNLVRFVTDKKKLAIARPAGTLENMIVFSNFAYVTDNKDDIEFIRRHPVYKVQVWESELPEGIRKKMQRDREMMTKSLDAFVMPEPS